jgi:hypothetical protein
MVTTTSSPDSNTSSSRRRVGTIRSLFVNVVVACLTLTWVELQNYGRNAYLLDKELLITTTSGDCGDGDTPLVVVEQQAHQQSPPPPQKQGSTDVYYHNETTTTSIQEEEQQQQEILIPLTNSNRLTTSSLAVMVLSRRTNFEVRRVIRDTWAKGHDNVYFVVGRGCTVPIAVRVRGATAICRVAEKPLPANYMELTQRRYDAERETDRRLQEEQAKYDDLVFMTDVDVYSNLPKKLKAAYSFVHEHYYYDHASSPQNNTTLEWVLKVDDDFYVKVDEFEKYLQATFPKNLTTTTPLVLGSIRRSSNTYTSGKWKEVSQYPPDTPYPPFPVGSAGHAVTRPVVEYISKRQHLLFDYQGEDASLGIWLRGFVGPDAFRDSSSSSSESHAMVNDGNCFEPGHYVIGHGLTKDHMKVCFENQDASSDQQAKLLAQLS